MKPEWYAICENSELQERFRELAQSFTHNPELREDLEQEAWLAVCEYLSGIKPASLTYKGGAAAGIDEFLARDKRTLGFYEKIGYRAMDKLRKKEAKQRELFKPWSRTATYRRVKRTFIRIKKKNEAHGEKQGVSLPEYSEGQKTFRAV